MADGGDEKKHVGLETQKQAKPHWDKMDKEELILQVKKVDELIMMSHLKSRTISRYLKMWYGRVFGSICL